MRESSVVSRILGPALICLLIVGLLTSSVSVALETHLVTAGDAGKTYLFTDPSRGTQLYVNTGSGVYRFAAPDGYDTGTVQAARMACKTNLIVINDRLKDFNFNCIIDFKENLCRGSLRDRPGGAYLCCYSITAPAAGAELFDDAVVPATTVVLGQTSLDCLSSASENYSVITFADTTRQLATLSVGDVVVSGINSMTPYGFLRQVTNVVFNEDQVVVETAAATLEDAIAECTVHGSWQLLADGTAVPLENQVGLSFTNVMSSPDVVNQVKSSAQGSTSLCQEHIVLYDADGSPFTTQDQITADCSLCSDIRFELGFAIHDWTLTEALFSITTVDTNRLAISAKVPVSGMGKNIEVYRQYLDPIEVWVDVAGWCFPITIVPLLTVNIGLEATISVGVTASVTQTDEVTTGLKYDHGAWSSVTNFSNSYAWEPPMLTAACGMKGYLGPQLDFLLYGFAGPYGRVRGCLELDTDILKPQSWELYGGLEAGVGFRVEVLGRNIADYVDPSVIAYRVLLAQAQDPEEIVTFPDPNLEAAIRDAIAKPTGDIYQSDLDGLTILDTFNRGIGDLTGLEHCTSLTYLDLAVNGLSDISPLSSLTSLTRLYLGENQISDVTPLSGLTSLGVLDLRANQIGDISPLSGLTSLGVLDLRVNQMNDISPLSGLTSLTYLCLYDNEISEITGLSSLTNLQGLDLFDNQISDITTLSGLTNLTHLDLSRNQISDITPLSGLTSLTDLYLSLNQISDITPLSALINLTSLNVTSNQISDVGPLVANMGLSSGDYLNLCANPLDAVSINTYIPQLLARDVDLRY